MTVSTKQTVEINGKVKDVLFLHEAKLKRFVALQEEIKEKSKILKELTAEIIDNMDSGGIPNFNSKFIAYVEVKSRITLSYQKLLEKILGKVKYTTLIKAEKVKAVPSNKKTLIVKPK